MAINNIKYSKSNIGYWGGIVVGFATLSYNACYATLPSWGPFSGCEDRNELTCTLVVSIVNSKLNMNLGF
jgi:hypothetical protein